MMRVSSGMMIGKYMHQINASYANQAKLMEQSDGSNLHRPSDNSVRYSRYLGYQNRNTENLQYQDNVKAGSSWMKTADAVMVNMTDIYTTLKEKTVDAGNDTNNDSDLITAIAKEFKAKLYEMVSLGNNMQGDRYLFSGQSDLTQPFSISTEYMDRGLTKTLDDPQTKFFKNPKDKDNLNADDTGNLTQFLELNDSKGERYFLNTMNGRMYTEDFIQKGYKDKLNEHIEHVQAGDEYAILPFFDTDALNVAGYFENTGVVRTKGNVSINGGESKEIDFGVFIARDLTPGATTFTSGDYAYADVPVYIKNDTNGNVRVVAAGNKIEFQDGEAMAYLGVPLDATSYQQGKVVSLNSTLSDPQADPALNFNAGKTYTLDTYEDAIADADVEYTDSNGDTVTVPAGSLIPRGVTINFLTDNTSILRDPKLVNNGENQAQSATYLKTLQSQFKAGTLSDVSVIADGAVTFEMVDPLTSTTSYVVVPAGSDMANYNGVNYIQDANDMKIGNLSAADFASPPDDTPTTVNTTIYFHNTLTSSEMETGKPVVFEDADGNPVSTVVLPSADVMIKDAEGNARMVKGGNPITLDASKGETEAIIIGKPQTAYHFDNFATIKQPIVTYHGDSKYISMVKLNGTVDQTADTVNTTGQDLNGSNIFDDKNSGNQTQVMSNGRLSYVSSGTAMINDMFTVCAKLEAGDRKWMRTDGITIADMAHEVITTTQATTAARQNVYESVSQMLTKQSESITQDINDVSATDVAELAVKLMQAQTIYNMSLSMGSRILPPTLADYL